MLYAQTTHSMMKWIIVCQNCIFVWSNLTLPKNTLQIFEILEGEDISFTKEKFSSRKLTLISDVVSLHRIFPFKSHACQVDIWCSIYINSIMLLCRIYIVDILIGQSRYQTKQAYLSPMGNFMIVLTLNSPHPAPSPSTDSSNNLSSIVSSIEWVSPSINNRAVSGERWAASAAR